MKKNIYYLLTIWFWIFVIISKVHAQGDKLEDLVPKATGESYEKTIEHLTWLTKQLHEGDNFHLLKEYPYRGFLHVKNDPTFQFDFSLFYECELKQQHYLESAALLKRGYLNIDSKEKMSLFVKLVFKKSQKYSVYVWQFPPDLNFLFFNDESKLAGITHSDDDGQYTIHIDDNTKTIKKEFYEYDKKIKQKKIAIRDIVKKKADLSEPKQPFQPPIKLEPNYCTKIPDKLMRTDIRVVLSRAERLRLAAIAGKAEPFIEHTAIVPREPTKAEKANPNFERITKWRANIWGFYAGNDLAFLGVHGGSIQNDCGCFLVFDDQSRLQRYAEGEIKFDYNSSGHEVAKTARVSDTGIGVEITFHKNGYPSEYKSIVKNRRFGRQIKWDENGNLISDIDQDIPLPQDTPNIP
ncbi:MAG: hypothetical protein LBC74_09545 [Planctomycetaceae bacterium]|jgi:antitoxin component YwqK of YwqJK toxin-antitoxin module|nr:hypothetical protein [Planctomycetaceae bacterium]